MAALADTRCEVAADVSLVRDDDLALMSAERHQAERDFALFFVGRGEDRGALGIRPRPSGGAGASPPHQREWLRR